MLVALEAIESLDIDVVRKQKKRAKLLRKANRHRLRVYTLNNMPIIIEQRDDREFRKMFRMDRENFEVFFSMLANYLADSDEKMAVRSSGSFVSKRSKVLCCLRFLAGASYLDLATIFGVSHVTLFSTDPHKGMIWPVIDAINIASVV